MVSAMRDLWRTVGPGGRLAISAWGPELFEPALGIWLEALRAELPPPPGPSGPSGRSRLEDLDRVRALFADAGVAAPVAAEYVAGRHPLRTPDDWWTIVMGSGMRGAIEQVGPDAAERVRATTLSRLAADDVRDVRMDVIYAVATRPS
jgi:hypothetical protein